MEIKIRDALVSDASTLVTAEKEIANNPGYLVSRPNEILFESFPKKIELLSRIPNGKYIVAEKNGQLIGHAFLDPMGLESIQHVVRLTIAVHSGFEGKGIGYLLMNHLIDWARNTPSVEKIELNVRATNMRAVRLYQKLGFNIESRIRNRVKFPSTEYSDDLEMGLFVGPGPTCLTVVSLPIGRVISSRKEAVDDDWDEVKCGVQLDKSQFTDEAVEGLSSFSHAEIIFQMNQVDLRKIELSSRHPRNNADWPKVGIFAQRGKNRPNQLGTTICRM